MTYQYKKVMIALLVLSFVHIQASIKKFVLSNAKFMNHQLMNYNQQRNFILITDPELLPCKGMADLYKIIIHNRLTKDEYSKHPEFYINNGVSLEMCQWIDFMNFAKTMQKIKLDLLEKDGHDLKCIPGYPISLLKYNVESQYFIGSNEQNIIGNLSKIRALQLNKENLSERDRFILCQQYINAMLSQK